MEYSALQELGHSLVSSGPKQFMQDVLKHGELDIREDLLIDGLRHSTVLDALRDIAAPQKVLLIFVETCDEIIASRLVDRGMKIRNQV
ncbi:MAG: hypothetical protein IPG06_13040 [Haliea sp.]|nr:hypothetical protein [Haliea sp.]